eukprot:XP_011662907.1 PREDICTED: nesprin-1 isoform X2 [Strongylocentrotus purpuratus]
MEERRRHVDEVDEASREVGRMVSSLDEESLRKHLNEIREEWQGSEMHIQRTQTMLEGLESDFNSLLEKAHQFHLWLDHCQAKVIKPTTISPYTEEVEKVLQEIQGLNMELAGRRATFKAVSEEESLCDELSPMERQRVRHDLQQIDKQLSKFEHTVTTTHDELQTCVNERKEFWKYYSDCLKGLEIKEEDLSDSVVPKLDIPDQVQQVFESKALQDQVKSYNSKVRWLSVSSQPICQRAGEKDSQDVQKKVIDLEKTFQRAEKAAVSRFELMSDSLTRVKELEHQMKQMKTWLDEQQSVISQPITLQCSLNDIHNQISQHKNVNDSSVSHKPLLMNLMRDGESLAQRLGEDEKQQITYKLDNIQALFNRTVDTTGEKYARLTKAYNDRVAFEADLSQCDAQFQDLKSSVDQLDQPIGLSSVDASHRISTCKDLQAKLDCLQAPFNKLNDGYDHMTKEGQVTHVQDIARLDQLNEELKKALETQTKSSLDAQDARKGYEDGMTKIQECLEHYHNEEPAREQLGLDMETKLRKCKVALEEITCLEEVMSSLPEQYQAVCKTANQLDQRTVNSTVHKMTSDLMAAKANLEQKQRSLEGKLSDKEALMEDLDRCLKELKGWSQDVNEPVIFVLEVEPVKEALCIHQTNQPKMDHTLEQAQALIISANAKFADLGEPITPKLQDQLQTLDTLHLDLLQASRNRVTNLIEAVNLREELQSQRAEVKKWLEEGEGMLKEAQGGINYPHGEQDLHQHRQFFSQELVYQNKMDDLVDLADRLSSSLTPSVREEMKADLSNLNSRLSSVDFGAREYEEKLHKFLGKWQDVLSGVNDVEKALNVVKERAVYGTPTSLPQAQDNKQLNKIENILQSQETQLKLLHSYSQPILEEGNPTGRESVSSLIQSVEDLFDSLQLQVESDRTRVEDQEQVWIDYNDRRQELLEVLGQAEDAMPVSVSLGADINDLQGKLSSVKAAKEILDNGETLPSRVTVASNELLESVLGQSDETHPVKKDTQESVNRYHKLHDSAARLKDNIEKELSERAAFETEADESLADFIQGRETLEEQTASIGPLVSDAEERINQLEAVKSELLPKLDHIEELCNEQHQKYKDLNSVPPSSISEKLEDLRSQKSKLNNQLDSTIQELNEAKKMRCLFQQQTCNTEQAVDKAKELLNKHIFDVPDAKKEHENLQDSLESAQLVMHSVQYVAQQLTDQTNRPDERSAIITTIASLQTNLAEVIHTTDQMTDELIKAMEPWKQHQSAKEAVERWLDQGVDTVKPTLSLGNMPTVLRQLQEHRALLEDVPDTIESVEALMSSGPALAKVLKDPIHQEKADDLKKDFQDMLSTAQERKDTLEDETRRWQNYQGGLMDLFQRIADAKDMMLSPDMDQMTLNQQLENQKEVLEKLEAASKHLADLNDAHKLLAPIFADQTSELDGDDDEDDIIEKGVKDPQLMSLQEDISRINDVAIQHGEVLQKSLVQQEAYEKQLELLEAQLQTAQDTMASPVEPTSMEQLQKQLAQHEVLAVEIQGYENEIQEINNKTQELQEEATRRTDFRQTYLAALTPLGPPMVATPEFGVGARLVRRGSPIRTPWRSFSPEPMQTSLLESKRPLGESDVTEDQPPQKKVLFADDPSVAGVGDECHRDDVDSSLALPSISGVEGKEMDSNEDMSKFPTQSTKRCFDDSEPDQSPKILATSTPRPGSVEKPLDTLNSKSAAPLSKVLPDPYSDVPYQIITDRGPAYVLRPAGSSSIIGQPGKDGDAPGGGDHQTQYVIKQPTPYLSPVVVRRVPIVERIVPFAVIDPKTGKTMEAVPTGNVNDLENNVTAYMVDPETKELEILDPENKVAVVAIPLSDESLHRVRVEEVVFESRVKPVEMAPDLMRSLPFSGLNDTDSDKGLDDIDGDNGQADVQSVKEEGDLDSAQEFDNIDSAKGQVYILSAKQGNFPSLKGLNDVQSVKRLDHVDGAKGLDTDLPPKAQADNSLLPMLPDNLNIGQHEESKKEPIIGIQGSQKYAGEQPQPSNTDVFKSKLGMAEESEKPNTDLHQVVTTKGPAYELRPVDSDSTASNHGIDTLSYGDDSKETVPQQYTVSKMTHFDGVPEVVGNAPVPWDQVPILIKDPSTDKILKIVPVVDPDDLKSKVTAYVQSDPRSKTLEIIDPQLLKSYVADAIESVHCDENTSKSSKLDEDRQALQLMTNKGLAYVLQPLSEEASPVQDVSPVGKKPEQDNAEFKIVDEARPANAAVVTGSRSSTRHKPIEILDQLSGQKFVAEPATNVNDLMSKPTLYLPETADLSKPMVIFHPKTSTEIVAFPATPQPTEFSKQPHYDSTYLSDSGSFTEPQREHIPSFITLKSMTVPVADCEYSKVKPSNQVTPVMTEPITHQVVTDHGPAYTLRPFIGSGGPTAGDDDPDVDFVLASQDQSDDPPVLTGEQKLDIHIQPLHVKDPESGQVMICEPMTDVNDLSGVLAVVGSVDGNPLMTVYNPATKQSGVAVPKALYCPPLPVESPSSQGDSNVTSYVSITKPVTQVQQTPTQDVTEPTKRSDDAGDEIQSGENIDEAQHEGRESDLNLAGCPLFSLSHVEVTSASDDGTQPSFGASNIIEELSPEHHNLGAEDLAKDEEEVGKPVSNQILTSLGPAYTLIPVELSEQSKVHPKDDFNTTGDWSQSKRSIDGIADDLPCVRADSEALNILPVVVGSKPSPKEDSFLVEDPVSKKIFKAKPVHSLDVLHNQPSVFVDDTSKPVQIHFPDSSLRAPITSNNTDRKENPLSDIFQILSKTPLERSLLSKQVGKGYASVPQIGDNTPHLTGIHSSMAMKGRDSLSTEDNNADEESEILVPHASKTHASLEEVKHQLVTDIGPAYILVPEDNFGSGGDGGGGSTFLDEYILATSSNPANKPSVIGSQPFSQDEPCIVRNPSTGQTFRALPAESLKDLNENPSLYALNSQDIPAVKVFDPSTGCASIGIPASVPHVEVTTKSPQLDQDKPVLQLITNKGPAYILQPLTEEVSTLQDVTPVGKKPEQDNAEFKIVDEARPANAAIVTGSASSTEIKPIEILDQLSGQKFVAEPATNVNDLMSKPTLYLPETADLSKPMVIFHPKTSTEIVAFPATPQPTEFSKQPHFESTYLSDSGSFTEPQREQFFGDIPSAITLKSMTVPVADCEYSKVKPSNQVTPVMTEPITHQVVTDHGPAYTLRPFIGSGGPTAGDDDPDVDFVLASQDQSDDPPVLTGEQKLDIHIQPLHVKDPESGQVMICEPMTDVNDLSGVLAVVGSVDGNPLMTVYNPATKQSGVAVPKALYCPHLPEESPSSQGDSNVTSYVSITKPVTQVQQTPTQDVTEPTKRSDDAGDEIQSGENIDEAQHEGRESDLNLAGCPLFSLSHVEVTSASDDGTQPSFGASNIIEELSPEHHNLGAEDLAKDEEEVGKPVSNQILTSLGPAYTLIPVELSEQSKVHPKDDFNTTGDWSQSKRSIDGIADDLPCVRADSEALNILPVVVGSKPSPKEDSFLVEDPVSKKIFKAKPVHSLDVLHSQPSVFVDDTSKPVQIHFPDSSLRAPITSTNADGKEKPVIPHASKTKASPEIVKHQLVTDIGPAYILVPEDNFGSGGDGGGGSTFLDEYILATSSNPANKPSVIGSQPFSQDEPCIVRNPSTGQTFRALPAESLKDLNEIPSLYALNSQDIPAVKVFDPSTGCASIGITAGVPQVEELVSETRLKPTEAPLRLSLPDTQSTVDKQSLGKKQPYDYDKAPGHTSMVINESSIPEKDKQSMKQEDDSPHSEDDVFESDKPEPIIQSDESTATSGAAIDTPFLLGWMEKDNEKPCTIESEQDTAMDVTGAPLSVPPVEQILTDRGAAYVLTPLSELKEHNGAAISGKGLAGAIPGAGSSSLHTSSPDYVIVEDTELKRLPVITGTQQIRDVAPFIIRDPKSGQDLAAIPATVSDDLLSLVGFTDDPKEDPLMIQDMQTGESMIALPAYRIPDELGQSQSLPTRDAGFYSRPSSMTVTDNALKYPIDSDDSSVDSLPLHSNSDTRHPTEYGEVPLKSMPRVRDGEEEHYHSDSTSSDFYTPNGSPVPWQQNHEAAPIPHKKETDNQTPVQDQSTEYEPVVSAADLLEQTLQIQPKVVLQKDSLPTEQSPSLIEKDKLQGAESLVSTQLNVRAVETGQLHTRPSPESSPLDHASRATSHSPVEVKKDQHSKQAEAVEAVDEKPKQTLSRNMPLPVIRHEDWKEDWNDPSTVDGKGQKIDQLNRSWDALKHKMEEKERLLKDALAKQEDYRNALSQINIRLANTEAQLKEIKHTPMEARNLDEHIQELKNLMSECSNLDENVSMVEEKATKLHIPQDILRETIDDLRDRVDKIKSDANELLQKLQKEKEDGMRVKVRLEVNQQELQHLDDWLTDFIKQLEPDENKESGDEELSASDIQEQLLQNHNHQLELSRKLQKLNDIEESIEQTLDATTCQTPVLAEHLETTVRYLHNRMDACKRNLADQREHHRMLLNTERLAQEYQSDVAKLQEWLEQQRGMMSASGGAVTSKLPPVEVGAEMLQQQAELQQKLEEELSAHQVLVKSVARRGAKRRSPSDNNEESKGIPLDLETDHELAEHRSKWEEISRQVAEKNRQLNASLEYIRPQDTPFVHHLPARRNLQLDVLNHDGKQEEDLKTSLDALNQCWAKMETQVSDQQSRLEQAYEFQTCYQDALQAVSGWLDGVQLKLFSEDWSKDTETQLKEHAALQEELKAFQDQLVHMNEACHLVQAETGARSKQLMQQSLDDVNQRLTTLETEARQREQQLVEKNRQFQGFQRDLQSFQLWLTGAKEQLNIPPINVSGASIEDNININKEERLKFQVLESEASRREMKYKDLVQKGEDLLALDPHLPAIAHDIATLQINWEELQRLLGNRRNQLNTAKILQEQYHKILKDYMEFLETAEKKLQNKTLSATDVDDLHHQLQKHKEFFSDLDTHHILIESIAQKADPFTQQLFHAQRSELDRRSQAIMAQATERGQTLEALVSDWRDLQASLRELSSWLGHVEAQVPSGINDATQDNVQKAIHKYQAMEGLLEGRQSSLRQVDSGAQALLRNLTSPQLEKQLALLRDQWSSVNQRVRHDLSSWTALLKEWRMFEQESIELIPWLRHVTDHMASLKDKDHTQKPISEQLEEFSKLQKDIEIHTPQKVSTCTHGNHLLKLKQLNTSPIREKLSSIESHWTDIQNELPQLQEDLHQSQMELLPSRQALNELMLWMDSLESALDSYNHKVYISGGDVKDTLQVYKGYKVDLSCHLLTVEFVNQSILQMSQDIESRRGDKTDFAEKLGTMNQRWQALNGRVGEETKVLELLLQRWKSFSKQVSDTNNTLKEQEDKVKLFDGPIGREASVKEALRICQAIEEHIKSKSSDLHQLKATAHSLTSDQESIKQTLQPLVNRQSALQRLVKHLKADQVTALEQWSLYQETLTVVQQALCKAEYALSRGNVIMGTVESLQVQTTKLRELLPLKVTFSFDLNAVLFLNISSAESQ